MAVGVAWSQHWGTGIGTTIAVAMHELPHEIGDFIVYKKLGLSNKQAVGLNLFAAMISYAGVFMGVALSSNQEITNWLLAVVAGLFIYISLVDVAPEMKLSQDDDCRHSRLILQNVGILTGFTLMILLALYE